MQDDIGVAKAVADWLPLFFSPNDVVECRFLDVGRKGVVHAGYMRREQIPALAKSIAGIARVAGGSYFTPQKLREDVLSRSAGKFPAVRRTNKGTIPPITTDADVEYRRYLMIDVDPVRPKGVSATDAERQSASDVADAVKGVILRCLPSKPLCVDSGNGYHLYYRLDEPFLWDKDVAADGRDSLSTLLKVIAELCDTGAATVDTSVFNPSRIMKIPGTWSRKGQTTKSRPHRKSKIIEVPNGWKP